MLILHVEVESPVPASRFNPRDSHVVLPQVTPLLLGAAFYDAFASWVMLNLLAGLTLLSAASLFATASAHPKHGLEVQIAVAEGLLNSSTTGRILVLFAPAGADPLDDTDVTSSPDYFYGKNVYNFDAGDTVTLAGGSGIGTGFGVWGFPNVSLTELPAGDYTVQAFLNQYETVTRSDGSEVSVRFPCGDGELPADGPGSLTTSATNITVSGDSQTIELTFDDVVPVDPFNGTEIGGCFQGNYPDTDYWKHVKIRSEALSKFWNRDMYVGANILLPHGYNANDTNKRYPVIYSQDHWAGGDFAFASYGDGNWTDAWYSGIIPGTNGSADRETPKMILVTFRHEAPY